MIGCNDDDDEYDDVDADEYIREQDMNEDEGSITAWDKARNFTYNPEDAFQNLTEGTKREISFKYSATDKEGEKSEESTIKLIITTCIGIIILIALYITKLIHRDTLITSLKDSLPYFTACFLFGFGGLVKVEWMALVLAAIIFIADFAGDD